MTKHIRTIVAMVAPVVLLILSICFGTYIGAALAAVLIAVSIFKEKPGIYIAEIIWAVAVAYVTYFTTVFMLHPQYSSDISLFELILNMFCIFIVYGVAFLITGRIRVSVTVSSFLLVVMSMMNTFIYGFRGKELGPMDFLSIGTAANVAGQYHFEITAWIAGGWAIWLAAVLTQFALAGVPRLPRLRSRLVALLMLVSFVCVLGAGAKNKPIKTWETEGTRLNGYYLNFYLALRDSKVEKPANYNPQLIESYARQYTTQEPTKEKPNIIVIMDESYADFRILGNELRTNIPVTPFLDSLTENTIRGNALTSVYGGNTANAEFEFLTGHSMAFLPDNTVPYQQYIDGEMYSLAWLMRSYGYKSVATHPYHADGWSRTEVYPNFGFSEYSFIEDYPSKDIIRGYISDREMFEYVVDYASNTDEPLFLFGITMQNHSGYDYEGYDNTIELMDYSRDYPMAQQYLSLLHETDSAMEYFINALKESPKETVVLFFGDHFPNVESEFYNEIHTEMIDTLDEQMLEYTVPFILWANYDIEEKTVGYTSLNYLSNYLLQVSGLEIPVYNQCLMDIETVIPAMNALGYYSVTQNKFVLYDEVAGDEAQCLEKYSQLQYNNLFDARNRNELMFGKYIHADKKE